MDSLFKTSVILSKSRSILCPDSFYYDSSDDNEGENICEYHSSNMDNDIGADVEKEREEEEEEEEEFEKNCADDTDTTTVTCKDTENISDDNDKGVDMIVVEEIRGDGPDLGFENFPASFTSSSSSSSSPSSLRTTKTRKLQDARRKKLTESDLQPEQGQEQQSKKKDVVDVASISEKTTNKKLVKGGKKRRHNVNCGDDDTAEKEPSAEDDTINPSQLFIPRKRAIAQFTLSLANHYEIEDLPRAKIKKMINKEVLKTKQNPNYKSFLFHVDGHDSEAFVKRTSASNEIPVIPDDVLPTNVKGFRNTSLSKTGFYDMTKFGLETKAMAALRRRVEEEDFICELMSTFSNRVDAINAVLDKYPNRYTLSYLQTIWNTLAPIKYREKLVSDLHQLKTVEPEQYGKLEFNWQRLIANYIKAIDVEGAKTYEDSISLSLESEEILSGRRLVFIVDSVQKRSVPMDIQRLENDITSYRTLTGRKCTQNDVQRVKDTANALHVIDSENYDRVCASMRDLADVLTIQGKVKFGPHKVINRTKFTRPQHTQLTNDYNMQEYIIMRIQSETHKLKMKACEFQRVQKLGDQMMRYANISVVFTSRHFDYSHASGHVDKKTVDSDRVTVFEILNGGKTGEVLNINGEPIVRRLSEAQMSNVVQQIHENERKRQVFGGNKPKTSTGRPQRPYVYRTTTTPVKRLEARKSNTRKFYRHGVYSLCDKYGNPITQLEPSRHTPGPDTLGYKRTGRRTERSLFVGHSGGRAYILI